MQQKISLWRMPKRIKRPSRMEQSLLLRKNWLKWSLSLMNNAVSVMTQWKRSRILHFVSMAVAKTSILSAWSAGSGTRCRITRPLAVLFAAPNGARTPSMS